MKHQKLPIVVLAFFAMAAVPSEVMAQSKPAEPTLGAHAILASIDRVDAAMKRAGFGGYRAKILSVLEDIGFLAPGTVDPSLPVAKFYVAGDALSESSEDLMMIPLKA